MPKNKYQLNQNKNDDNYRKCNSKYLGRILPSNSGPEANRQPNQK